MTRKMLCGCLRALQEVSSIHETRTRIMEGVIMVTEVTVVIEIFTVEVEVITRTIINKGMPRSTSPIRTIQVVVIEEIIGVVVLTTITTIDRIQQI